MVSKRRFHPLVIESESFEEIDIENSGSFEYIYKHNQKQKQQQKEGQMTSKPKLVHPALHDIPQDLRYIISGVINTVGFMTSLYLASVSFREIYSSSTIYTFSNLFYIPIGHAISSLLVFGWPAQYLKNLLMNAPIGLTATVIGSLSTEFLDRMEFDAACYNLLKGFSFMEGQDGGNMFTNFLVMIITGIWGYTLSTVVNSSPKPKDANKEL